MKTRSVGTGQGSWTSYSVALVTPLALETSGDSRTCVTEMEEVRQVNIHVVIDT